MRIAPLASTIGMALAAALVLAGCGPRDAPVRQGEADIAEYAVAYPERGIAPRNGCLPQPGGAVHPGSTHEITYDPAGGGDLWITGQNYDRVVRVKGGGAMAFTDMPEGSGPHGIEFDAEGRLWVTLECHGRVRTVDGAIDHDITLAADDGTRINPRPHGLGIGADGRTLWFTGKAIGTIGRIAPDGRLTTIALSAPDSTPIYIRLGPDGNMWVTELTGNRIARVTPEGKVTEFPIPTANSRPIAIVPGPDGAMWFSEEAGNKVARIDRNGAITEYAVPKPQDNVILAGLAFDDQGHLWVQQYVDHNHPDPKGEDHLVRIDKAGLAAGPEGLKDVHFASYAVPTRDTVMHRIIQGPDRAMWFTEMHADKVGRLVPKPAE